MLMEVITSESKWTSLPQRIGRARHKPTGAAIGMVGGDQNWTLLFTSGAVGKQLSKHSLNNSKSLNLSVRLKGGKGRDSH